MSLATLDNFIYVADHAKGFYAIESRDDGTYSPPRVLPLEPGLNMPVVTGNLPGDFNFLPKPVSMVILTLAALNKLAGGLFAATVAMVVLLG